jgi:hypothetical protein
VPACSGPPQAPSRRCSRLDAANGLTRSARFHPAPRRGDKSFFVIAAAGGAAVLGALYFFLNSQM